MYLITFAGISSRKSIISSPNILSKPPFTSIDDSALKSIFLGVMDLISNNSTEMSFGKILKIKEPSSSSIR